MQHSDGTELPNTGEAQRPPPGRSQFTSLVQCEMRLARINPAVSEGSKFGVPRSIHMWHRGSTATGNAHCKEDTGNVMWLNEAYPVGHTVLFPSFSFP